MSCCRNDYNQLEGASVRLVKRLHVDLSDACVQVDRRIELEILIQILRVRTDLACPIQFVPP